MARPVGKNKTHISADVVDRRLPRRRFFLLYEMGHPPFFLLLCGVIYPIRQGDALTQGQSLIACKTKPHVPHLWEIVSLDPR